MIALARMPPELASKPVKADGMSLSAFKSLPSKSLGPLYTQQHSSNFVEHHI